MSNARPQRLGLFDTYRLGRAVAYDQAHFLDDPGPLEAHRYTEHPDAPPELRLAPGTFARYREAVAEARSVQAELRALPAERARQARLRYPPPPQAGPCFLDAALPDFDPWDGSAASTVHFRFVDSGNAGATATLIASLDRHGRPTGRILLLTCCHSAFGRYNWPNGSRAWADVSFGFRNAIANDPDTDQEPDNPDFTVRRELITRMSGWRYREMGGAHRDLTVLEVLGGVPLEVLRKAGARYAGWKLHGPGLSHDAHDGACVLGHGGGWPLHGTYGKGRWEVVDYPYPGDPGAYVRLPEMNVGRLIPGHSGSALVGSDGLVVGAARTGGDACTPWGYFRPTSATLRENWEANPQGVPGATLLDLLAGGNREFFECHSHAA